MSKSKDKYRYFRIEARELLEGLNRAVLELEKGGRVKELIEHILRLAHTLKGASRVMNQTGIAELAHAMEDLFGGSRDHEEEVPREKINRALGMLDSISVQIAALDLPEAKTPDEKPRPMADFAETVRVEIGEADRLLSGVAEAAARITALRRAAGAIDHARALAGRLIESLSPESKNADAPAARANARALADELRFHLEELDRRLTPAIDQIETEFAQVRDAAGRLRLLPVSTVFSSLERAVRDAAQALRKDVAFESSGGGNRLDTQVLAGLGEALLHVVRNAVAHGIESRAERSAAGKPVRGRVELRVERRGSRVALICGDDGRGIDAEAVRRAAGRQGLTVPSQAGALTPDEVMRLMMQSGVSTAHDVDEISGRGIGLDAVREIVGRLKGEVAIQSEPGRGTSVELIVPVSLSSMVALEVEAGGARISLPLDAVRTVLRISDREIARSSDRESIIHEGKLVPFLSASRALRLEPGTARGRTQSSAVVLEASTGRAAIGIDRLVGTTVLVVRALPAFAEADPVVAGASLDAEGNPQLVLDAEELVALACLDKMPATEELSVRPPSVLVIDDSLTTRMLEQSILESAGYDVDLAISGEEGLDKARKKNYSVFLVDVEMPGIDGFEFISRTQLDPLLRAVPSILVTSLNAAEHRQRAEAAGARAFMAKSEFNQGYLLQKIRELIV